MTVLKFRKLFFLTFLISLFSVNVFSQEVESGSVEVESSVENEIISGETSVPAETVSEIVPEVSVESEEISEPVSESQITAETDLPEEVPVVSEQTVVENSVEELSVVEETKEPEKTEEPEDKRIPMQMKSISELNEESAASEQVLQDFSDLDKEEVHKNPAWYDEIFNSDIPFFNRLDFIFGFEPTIYMNAHSKTTSAPSPIVYPLYFGFNWPNDTFISFEPSFKFFSTYYLVNNDMVLPAEIENRTVNAYSCMFNIPVVFKFKFWDKFDVKLNSGIGFLIRIPSLAEGVSPDDSGYYGTAQDDYEYIKNWLVLSWRFLYLSGGVDCLFKITDTLSMGPEFSMYLPLGTIFSDWTVDGMMVSVGVKIAF